MGAGAAMVKVARYRITDAGLREVELSQCIELGASSKIKLAMIHSRRRCFLRFHRVPSTDKPAQWGNVMGQ
jgi:hypothetical protein